MSRFALLIGLPSEPPIAAVARALERTDAAYLVLSQRALARGSVHTRWADGASACAIEADGERFTLDDVAGVYTRITNWSDLPEAAQDDGFLARAQQIHEALETWLETTSACVINRTSANDTNNSKPYQAAIIRDYFDVPDTLVTNDPATASAFLDAHSSVIYKSISGERSIVTAVSDVDRERLPLLATAPVQFQERVPGLDIRVHVVGEEVFASAVECDAVDYRYDPSGAARFTPVELPAKTADACIALTARLGLELSGVDLRLADDGRIVCFEVNPSPAYSVYESATGQPIAAAIARHLTRF